MGGRDVTAGTVRRAWRAFEKRRDVRIVSWALLMGMLAHFGFGLISWGEWWDFVLGDYVTLVLFAVFFTFLVFVVVGAALILFPWKDSRK